MKVTLFLGLDDLGLGSFLRLGGLRRLCRLGNLRLGCLLGLGCLGRLRRRRLFGLGGLLRLRSLLHLGGFLLGRSLFLRGLRLKFVEFTKHIKLKVSIKLPVLLLYLK